MLTCGEVYVTEENSTVVMDTEYIGSQVFIVLGKNELKRRVCGAIDFSHL